MLVLGCHTIINRLTSTNIRKLFGLIGLRSHFYIGIRNNADGLAVTAMEPSIGTANSMMMTAEGANHILLVPTRFEDGLAALFLGGEVVGQFEDGVESAEVNHKAQVSRFLCSYIP